MFFIGFDNQLLSLQYELCRFYQPPINPLSLSSRTISVFIQNPTIKFKFSNQRDIPDCYKFIGNNSYESYTPLLEFPMECYQQFILKVSTEKTREIIVFTKSPETAKLWKQSTNLKVTLVSLKSNENLFASNSDKVIFVDDELALSTAKQFYAKGIMGGIETGAVLSLCKDDDEDKLFILSDSALGPNYEYHSSKSIPLDARYVVEDLQLPVATTVFESDNVMKALELMELNQFSQLPVLNAKRRVIGMISKSTIQSLLNTTSLVKDHQIKFNRKDYFKVTPETRLVDLEEGFKNSEFLFVTVDGFPLAVVTREDVDRFRDRVI